MTVVNLKCLRWYNLGSISLLGRLALAINVQYTNLQSPPPGATKSNSSEPNPNTAGRATTGEMVRAILDLLEAGGRD